MGKRTNTAVWLEKQSRWQVNVQKDGQRRSFTSSKPGRTGQREANAKADAWLDDGITGTSTKCSLLLDDFLADIKERTGTGNYRNEESRVRIWIKPIIGNIKIGNLNEQHLQKVINKAFQKGLSRKSLTNLRATMSAFLKYCRKVKASTLNPENIAIPQGARIGEKRILQPEHLVTLFTSEKTFLVNKYVRDEYINAYRFQVLTGLRPGELLGLMWSDINGKLVSIRRSVNILGEITSGKNKNAIRTFVMTQAAANIIADQRKQAQSLYVFNGIKEPNYRQRWKRYCEVNGIPPVSPYELRHTFVSVAKNLSEGQVKQIVGHSKNMDTFGVYGHQIHGEMQQTADQLEQIFQSLLETKKA